MVKQRNEEKEPEWSECSSMEEWAEKMIRAGYIEIVRDAVNLLPESDKEKYREIYRRVMAETKGHA
jgi:ribosomal 50S subunit-associated protein YjgA (DUF615 family)